jgi:hypothetical protein
VVGSGSLSGSAFSMGGVEMTEPVPQWLAKPHHITDPNWKYIPSASTDILKRFREMGWIPPSELKSQGENK